ncbi:WD40 repeat-like protein [Myriangium duriaei CBS 260.36]|uniref:WD40 repeat-like protein n=1 Tax=Myriangium duriaei CBS 260.36 TaxID=1168546 RepID=A0A9P4ITA7_9PEZI|nr:WD40 repeat-like protein [Myriangium duriaei CBS 260.36]
MSGEPCLGRRGRLRELLHFPRKPSPSSAGPAQPISPPTASSPGPSVPTQPSQATPSSQRVLQKALSKLSAEQQRVIKPYADASGLADAGHALLDAHAAAGQLQQNCQDKAWHLTFRGKTYLLRDIANRVLVWVDKLKFIGDTFADADPLYIGIPWKAFCLLSQLAVSHHSEMEALLKGLDVALCAANRLQAYLIYLQRLPVAKSTDIFEGAAVKFYALILEFIATAIGIYQKNRVSQIWQAIWKMSTIESFEDECSKQGSEIEVAANICDRELNEQDRRQWKADFEQQLNEIKATEASLVALHDKVDSIDKKVDITQVNVILAKLETAKGAMHDSYSDPDQTQCLPGTRTDLLQRIHGWVSDKNGDRMFWLCGKAGTGKSTISRTIATSLARSNSGATLGASFFFKRGGGDRGNASRVLPTIAYQLAAQDSQICGLVAKAVEDNFDLSNKSLDKQFEELFLPLMDATNFAATESILVVVLDALDECDDLRNIQTLLKLLAGIKTIGPYHIRIFVTSRPDVPIQLGFKRMDREGTGHEDMVLEEAQSDPLEHSIRLLLLATTSLSWLGRLSDAIEFLHQLRCSVDVKKGPQLLEFLNDGFRFLLQYRFVIDLAPLQLYHSALRFAPKRSMIRKTFNDHLLALHDFELVPESPSTWTQEIQKLEGHTAFVTAIAFSPNGELLASTSADKTVQIWNTRTGEREKKLEGHDVRVHLVAFSPDSKLLASASYDHVIRVWDVHTGEQVQIHDGANDMIRAIVFSSEGHLISLVGNSKLWNISTGKVEELEVQGSRWEASAVSSKRQTILSVFRNRTIESWDICTGKGEHNWEPETVLSFVNYSPDGTSLVAATNYQGSSSRLHGLKSRAKMQTHRSRRVRFFDGYTRDLTGVPGEACAVAVSPDHALISLQLDGSRLVLRNDDKREIIRFLDGHEGPIIAAAFSSDSKILISLSRDRTLRLWNPWTGQEIGKLNTDADCEAVTSIAYCASSNMVVSASGSKSIRLWNAGTGETIRVLHGKGEAIHSLAVSRDGQSVASVATDSTILVWNVSGGEIMTRLKDEGLCVNVAFSPNGKELASVSAFERIRRWNVATGAMVRSRQDKIESIYPRLAISPDGTQIALATNLHTVQLLDAQSGSMLRSLSCEAGINSVIFSPDEEMVATATNDGLIQLWSAQTGEKIGKPYEDSTNVLALDFSPDGKSIASGSVDGTVRLWGIQKDQDFEEPPILVQTNRIMFSPNGQIVASLDFAGNLQIWDARSGKKMYNFEGIPSFSRSLAFSPDSKLLVWQTFDFSAGVLNVETGQRIDTLGKLQNEDDLQSRIWMVAFSPCGGLLAIAFGLHATQVLDINAGKRLFQIQEQGTEESLVTLSGLCFSPDGSILATACGLAMTLWDIRNKQVLREIDHDGLSIQEVAFCPSGELIASSSGDHKVRLWDVRTGDEVHSFQHDQLVEKIAFTPDGEMMVCMLKYGNGLQLWNIRSGAHLLTMKPPKHVKRLNFSADGRIMYTDEGTFELQIVDTTCSKGNSYTRVSLIIEGRWLRYRDQDLLWLPKEYRTPTTDVHDKTMVIKKSSGGIAFFRLRDGD